LSTPFEASVLKAEAKRFLIKIYAYYNSIISYQFIFICRFLWHCQ
jgi:hypothetical protein